MKWPIGIGTLWPQAVAIAPPTVPQDVALKDLMPKGIVIGVAINQRQSDGVDAAAVEIITKQFNQISPENLLKFQPVHPAADRYAFEAQDRYVQFGVDRKMQVIGHTLVWHQQTPAWVFQGADGRPPIARRSCAYGDHIHTVVGRYKGKIHGGTPSTRRSTRTARCARPPGATGPATTTSPGRSSSRGKPIRTPSSITTTTTSRSRPCAPA